MTTFGDQVRQYGGVPVGINRLAEIFNKDNIWFVDYDNGATAHGGQKPDDAFALPSEAVSAASKEGIIYVRPRTSATSSDVYYTDAITIPVTKPQIQLIGAGAGTVPGYRGSAQIRPATTAGTIITIRASGVVVENLSLNNSGSDGTGTSITCHRTPTYPGSVAPQIRQCRIMNDTCQQGSIFLGSAQYCIVEDNVFLGCRISLRLEATHGSPQNYVIQRNKFLGLATERDTDILIIMTDINSRGHVIANNLFGDALPAHASGSYTDFIHDAYATTSVATGIISGNHFATLTADQCGTTGSNCTLAAGWFFTGNTYDGTSAAGLDGFLTKA